MEKHLWKMGIRTIRDLANTPLSKLRSKWGVNGEVIWRVANGLDNSPVTVNTHSTQKDIGNGMTLPRDFTEAWEIEVVILDICTEVCRRARKKGLMSSVVSVSVSGADFDHPTGFHRQVKLSDPTNITVDVCKIAKRIFHQHWDGQPVRRVGVSLSQLSNADTYQLSFLMIKSRNGPLIRLWTTLRIDLATLPFYERAPLRLRVKRSIEHLKLGAL